MVKMQRHFFGSTSVDLTERVPRCPREQAGCVSAAPSRDGRGRIARDDIRPLPAICGCGLLLNSAHVDGGRAGR